jgi:hypothetical protein
VRAAAAARPALPRCASGERGTLQLHCNTLTAVRFSDLKALVALLGPTASLRMPGNCLR